MNNIFLLYCEMENQVIEQYVGIVHATYKNNM